MELPTTANAQPPLNLQAKENVPLVSRRLISVDVTRGLVVLFSVFATGIPWGGYEQFRHPAWYGLTLFDLIFPSFLTLFGVGMALAYKNGVRWKRFCLRTVRLIIFGLLFNMVVDWSLNLQTLRITSVLLLYAVLGIAAVGITHFTKNWKSLLLLGLAVSLSYLVLLMVTSAYYPGGVPQPDHNLSGLIDPKIFGASHIYNQGRQGYDPEGVLNMYSALANVLFGYAAGVILYTKGKRSNLYLLFIGIGLIVGGYFLNYLLPFNKKIWTPSYALFTAGIAIAALSVLHTLLDYGIKWPRLVRGGLWYLEAFGRNSFLVYFGKMIVLSFIRNVSLSRLGINQSITDFLLTNIQSVITYHPKVFHALVLVAFWSLIAAVLHYKKCYIKV